MLRIGKTPQNIGAVQPRRAQIALGDLYQLYAQASRSVEQSAQLVWYSMTGDYVLTATADLKKGAVWQLSHRFRMENTNLWTIATTDVAEVYKRVMLDAK